MIWKELLVSAEAQTSLILDEKDQMVAAVYAPSHVALVRLAPQLRAELRTALSLLEAMKNGAAVVSSIRKVLAECP